MGSVAVPNGEGVASGGATFIFDFYLQFHIHKRYLYANFFRHREEL